MFLQRTRVTEAPQVRGGAVDVGMSGVGSGMASILSVVGSESLFTGGGHCEW